MRRTCNGIDYDAIIEFVERAAGVDRERAERALRATLQTLAERISGGEARQLAAQLPPELSPWLNSATRAESFQVDEFLRRIATREEVDLPTAERDARIVLAALARAVSPRELHDVASELSKSFAPLLPRGRYVEVQSADEFVRRVAQKTGLDEAAAQRATEAVLTTLGERIAGGEVDDLITRLPVALHGPLKAGRARSGGVARRMSFDEFVRRVADREDTSPLVARDHVIAVLATLREAIGEDEFLDVTAQLPEEYLGALVRAG
jgi:uncharacterized protein (DUF2267 family)